MAATFCNNRVYIAREHLKIDRRRARISSFRDFIGVILLGYITVIVNQSSEANKLHEQQIEWGISLLGQRMNEVKDGKVDYRQQVIDLDEMVGEANNLRLPPEVKAYLAFIRENVERSQRSAVREAEQKRVNQAKQAEAAKAKDEQIRKAAQAAADVAAAEARRAAEERNAAQAAIRRPPFDRPHPRGD